VQTVSQGREVHIQLATAKGEIRLNATTILAKSAYHPDRVAHFHVSEPAEISICDDKSCFKARSFQPWVRTETETHARFQTIASLRQSDLRLLSASKVLLVEDNFGTATSDVSLATTLSKSGFSNGVNLLLRLRKKPEN
jgi:hypothetical protein